MTTAEFIAWFEGFTQNLRGRPNGTQWKEILARVGSLEAGSPLKAWFDGLRVKVSGPPNEKVWSETKRQIAQERERAASKKGRLQNLFESFEQKDAALRDAPGAKARSKK